MIRQQARTGAFLLHMKFPSPKDIAEAMLAKAGVKVGGTRPWDIAVHDDRLYRRVLLHGSIGLGEAYMDGWWDARELDAFFEKVLGSHLDGEVGRIGKFLQDAVAVIQNQQTFARAFEVGRRHYDLGNDLYEAMLDPRMIYSCGYWMKATVLEEAQEHKLDLICRKLDLRPGQHILDIGCGWGGFAKFAAERYGVSVTGITISREQAALTRTRCAGLPVRILLQDYRYLEGTFDHIVSVGMFEHVGHKNYRTFMEIANRHLKNNGLFLLHTIGTNRTTVTTDPWLRKYIFPNGLLPSMKQISEAMEGIFVMEDWHNFGPDYDRTLMAWHDNFERRWPELGKRYDERFRRMWNYYLLGSAVTFRIRDNHLWQMILSKHGVRGGYRSVR